MAGIRIEGKDSKLEDVEDKSSFLPANRVVTVAEPDQPLNHGTLPNACQEIVVSGDKGKFHRLLPGQQRVVSKVIAPFVLGQAIPQDAIQRRWGSLNRFAAIPSSASDAAKAPCAAYLLTNVVPK